MSLYINKCLHIVWLIITTIGRCIVNECKSPTFDILRVAEIFGLYDNVVEMIQCTKIFDKR